MIGFIAQLIALLALIDRSSAQCTPYVDNNAQYNIQLCSLTSTTLQPGTISAPTVWTPTSFDSSISNSYTLNFPVSIYGVMHSSFYFNSNGALFFGTVGSTLSTSTIPVSSSYGDYLPIISPMWNDLYYTSGLTSALYGTIGSVGSRQQIIRFTNWNPYFSRPSNFSFDVIFYEDRPGDFDIRYYQLDVAAALTTSATVGIQSWDDGGSSWTLFNGNNQWTTIQSTLLSKQLSFHYIGLNTTTERCAGLGYNFESIRGTQLNFTDSTGVVWLYSPCGVVTDSRCAGNTATDKAMICQVPVTGTPVDLGVWGPGSIDWQYPVNNQVGVEAVVQSGSYCASISADRFTTVAYVCDATATTPVLYDATTPFTCVYRLQIRTALACNGGSRGNDTELLYPASLLTVCNRVTGAAYDAALCPRGLSDRRPTEYTGMVSILAAVSVGTTAVPLQFPFWFYGQQYTTAYVSLNGAIYFGATSTATPGAAPTYGFSTPASFPAIFAFGASLSNLAYSGLNQPTITHVHTTINGRLAFVVRYQNVKYTAYRGLYDMVLSFDIILYEGTPGGVEIKYYNISPNPIINVAIGIHGPNAMDVYTGYSNSVSMSAALASQLQGATLSYNYTGHTLVDACSAYGFNFTSSITSDLVYNDASYTYVVAPCGSIRSATPCPAGTSVCQILTNTTTAYVLSTANPSATSWSTLTTPLAGIRSTVRDGAYCTVNSQPRTMLIDWICSKTSSLPQLVSLTEVSTCTYNAIIYTPLVCSSSISCSNVTSSTYRGSLCPVAGQKIVQTAPVQVLANVDDDAVRITLPFNFHMSGIIYRYVWIGSNGILGFGPVKTSSIGTSLPLSASDLGRTPLIAALWSDLNIVDASVVAYSTDTVDGRRAFVVRYQDIEFYNSGIAGSGDAVNFDVILFEGLSGDIEIRYFSVNMPGVSRTISVGIQGDDTDREAAIVLASSLTMTPAVAASFSNSTLKISYFGPDVSTAPCAGLGYNLTSLRDTELRFNTSSTVSFVLRICNIVSDSLCQSSSVTDQSMLCRRTQAATAVNPTLDSIGEWNPSVIFWRYGAGGSGVQLVAATGQSCSGSPYTTILNFVCDAGAITPVITGISENPTCFVFVNITTSFACGAGDRNVPVPPPTSTLPACINITGLLYNAQLCPRSSTDSTNTPEVLLDPTNILVTDNNAVSVPLNMNFTVYGRQEDNIAISSNGLLTFGYTAVSARPSGFFPSMGLNSDGYPNIAPFYTDLINQYTSGDPLPYNGFIQYAYSGNAPNRRMIIRFQDVDYYTTRASYSEPSVSFDVILTETALGAGSGGIEIRYYQVDSTAQNVVIGMHGYGSSYTAVQNYVQLTRSIASQMTASTLRFTWTGVAQPDVCSGVPGGYNLGSLSNRDLTVNTSTNQYWMRPCGLVSAPVCTRQYGTSRVSVCQTTLDGALTYALAGDSPGSTVYSMASYNTLRATINDGLYCNTAARITVIDYVCNATAIVAFIESISESPVCTYNFRVQTNVTCVTPLVVRGTGSPVYYDATLTLDASLPVNKPTLTNPTAILAAGDDNVQALTIPFPIRVFGNMTTSVTVSVNGFITFTSSGPTGVPITSFPLSSTYTSYLPVLSVFMSDLHNSNKIGTAGIFWSIEGITPNRVFVIRWNEVNYFATRQAATLPDSLLTFDVRLYESSNTIDVQYWSIGSYAQSIGIGLQGITGSSTVLISAQTYAARGLFMAGRTVRYVFVDPAAPSSSSSTAGSLSSSAAALSSPARSSSVPSSSAAVAASSSSPAFTVTSSSQSSATTPSSSSAARSSSSTPSVASSSAVSSISSSSSAMEVVVDTDSSSSSSLSGGAIAGIVVGSVIGALILCVVLAVLCFGLGRGTKGSTRLDDDHIHQESQNGPSASDVEMETV